MKRFLRSLVAWLASTHLVRWPVGHLIYPNILRYLKEEIQPDVASPSGIVEDLSWKVHSGIVMAEELCEGRNCAEDGLRCDSATRARIIDTVLESITGLEGDILEFGVAGGESLLTFATRCRNRTVYGFDWYKGLPEDWWTRPAGTFADRIPDVSGHPNTRLVVGLFEETLPKFLPGWTGKAALVHIDCDLYKSTCTALAALPGHMQNHMVVLFDEYYNYPGFARHEWLAWRQFAVEHGLKIRCIAYDGRRAAFQILEA